MTPIPHTALPAHPTIVFALDGLDYSVAANGFVPGELVTATLYSDPIALGSQVADADGAVLFAGSLAAPLAPGVHRVELSGPQTGVAAFTFHVGDQGQLLPATGATPTRGAAIVALFAIALGLIVTGSALVTRSLSQDLETDHVIA